MVDPNLHNNLALQIQLTDMLLNTIDPREELKDSTTKMKLPGVNKSS